MGTITTKTATRLSVVVVVCAFTAYCLAITDSDNMTAFYLSKAGAVVMAVTAWSIHVSLSKLSKGGRGICTRKSRGM